MSRTRAYAISADDIARETERVGNDLSKVDLTRVIKLDQLELRPVGHGDVRLKILAVSTEHNIVHAALADTGNIAQSRGGKIFPGNSAVGEVIEVGPGVKRFEVGDIALTQGNGEVDRSGYPVRIWAYDQLGSDGWYAEEAVVGEWQLVPAPLHCGLSLWEIAALPVRAPSAYHLWRRATGIFRVKVPREHRATLNVLSFGGGVGELFLMLARSEGHNAFLCSGTPARRLALEERGIVGIDQLSYGRFKTKEDVRAFARDCKQLTNGEGMHVVCDMFRGPLFDAGIAVAARCGVNVSSGWQLSQSITYNTTLLSVKQVTLDHMHYETPAGCNAATELYGTVFKPKIHDEIYSFEDLPRSLDEMHKNTQTGIPVVRVARTLPASVQGINRSPIPPAPPRV